MYVIIHQCDGTVDNIQHSQQVPSKHSSFIINDSYFWVTIWENLVMCGADTTINLFLWIFDTIGWFFIFN